MDDLINYLRISLNVPVKVESIDRQFGTGVSFVVKYSNAYIEVCTREESNIIFLLNIHTKNPLNLQETVSGTGRGCQLLKKIKEYAEIQEKCFAIVGVTASGLAFWKTIAWLQGSPVVIDLEGKKYLDDRAFLYSPEGSGRIDLEHDYYLGVLPMQSFLGVSY